MTRELKKDEPKRTRRTVKCGADIEDHEYAAPVDAKVYVKNDGVSGVDCNIDAQLLDSKNKMITGANFQPGEFDTLTGGNVKRVLITCVLPPSGDDSGECVIVYSLDPPPAK